ncbi:hypothetical protein D3C78_1649800 [compost metagenome]
MRVGLAIAASERVGVLGICCWSDPLFQVVVTPELDKCHSGCLREEVNLETLANLIGNQRVFPSEEMLIGLH